MSRSGSARTTSRGNNWRRWRKRPPERREALRERLREFRNLPPEERERLREEWRRFRELPPEERERLRREWQERRRLRGGAPEPPHHPGPPAPLPPPTNLRVSSVSPPAPGRGRLPPPLVCHPRRAPLVLQLRPP